LFAVAVEIATDYPDSIEIWKSGRRKQIAVGAAPGVDPGKRGDTQLPPDALPSSEDKLFNWTAFLRRPVESAIHFEIETVSSIDGGGEFLQPGDYQTLFGTPGDPDVQARFG
jgi:hypothetical protein